MAGSSNTVFQIRELPEQRSFRLSDEFVRDALSAIAGQAELELDNDVPGELSVDVEVSDENGTVLARGHLSGGAWVACSRCLTAVELTVDEDFMLTFLPRAEHADVEDAETETEADIELGEEDLDVAAHDGKEVDLAPVLRDHIVLSVPYAPLCAEACKGLCAQCGVDLNKGTCECKQPAVAESPWAALKNFKLE